MKAIASESALRNTGSFSYIYCIHVKIQRSYMERVVWSQHRGDTMTACDPNQENKYVMVCILPHQLNYSTAPKFCFSSSSSLPLPFKADLLYPTSCAKHFTDLFNLQQNKHFNHQSADGEMNSDIRLLVQQSLDYKPGPPDFKICTLSYNTFWFQTSLI